MKVVGKGVDMLESMLKLHLADWTMALIDKRQAMTIFSTIKGIPVKMISC